MVLKLSSGSRDPTPADRFLDAVRAQTRINPLNDRERAYDDAVVELVKWGRRVDIVSLRAFEPRSGAGTRVLRRLCALADEHGVELELDPVPFGPNRMAPSKLAAWYERHGFSWEDPNDTMGRMVRRPRAVASASGRPSLAALLAARPAPAAGSSNRHGDPPWRQTVSAFLGGALPNPYALRFRERRPDRRYTFVDLPHVWYPEDLWYHGTRETFTEFKVAGVKRAGGGIGALLGVHFAANPATAERFASGELYRAKGDTRPGRIVAARLFASQVLDVGMEYGLYDDIVRRLFAAGLLDAHFLQSADVDPKRLANPKDGHFGSRVIQAMRSQKGNYAKRYTKLLRDAGIDAIRYANGVESEGFGTPAIIVQPAAIRAVNADTHWPHVVHVVNAVAHGVSVPARVRREYPGLERLQPFEAHERLQRWSERFKRTLPPAPARA